MLDYLMGLLIKAYHKKGKALDKKSLAISRAANSMQTQVNNMRDSAFDTQAQSRKALETAEKLEDIFQ